MPYAPGTEASIVRIAGAGFRLSLLLNAAACQLAQSRIDIHSIAKGISLFALTLKHVGQTLEATDLDRSPEATEKAWEIAGQGQMVFIEIEHMLDKLKGTDANDDLQKIPVQERLRWCFPKQHVTYLLAQLESLKLSLIVVLRVLQLGSLIKSSADNPPSSLTVDDAIAQEKAETQNMIIVRYWSVKRLDRLWDMVEQEAMEAANDETNQMISSNYSAPNTAAALKPLVAATKGSELTRLPAVTFGNSDVGLSDIERSPKDMVHLSESAMNQLLSVWVPSLDSTLLRDAGKPACRDGNSGQPRVYVSSDSENDSKDLDFDGPEVRGYYLEGKTVDWRQPQSQEARHHAAQMRRRYSSYQAQVESDSDDDNARLRTNARNNKTASGSSDENEQRAAEPHRPSLSVPTNGGSRAHSSSMPSRYSPTSTTRQPAPYSSNSFLQPTTVPHQPPPQYSPGPPPLQQPYRHYPNQDYSNTPRSIPITQPNQYNQPPPPATMPNTSPRGTPPGPGEQPWGRQPVYNSNNPHQPRHYASAYPLSTSSPESGWAGPPRPPQPSPSHSHRRTTRDDTKETRERERERHKNLTRNATRGLAGVGAIAGFMDALEAFDIL
ncbi:hypothetical protein N7474_004048 [Penicillium riverlandense]|uniref:uncharacterized protein n=1 Tax=Penicillium riverlandense TaxID=1903569 RepID=UPI0025474B8C|nr:uncharacterized protein N7474_004048 [Penicillium riverlandense]KAJ5818457.1 hypothetical protein N7474_004048 [Penicillium riverlandense]